MIRFENVGMRYGTGPEVLRDLSFQIADGGFYFLTGASGAGKSSLLKLLSLTHRPSRGLVTFFSHDLAQLRRRDLPPLRRRIGVVFQDFRLIEHLSALENVALPLRIAGAPEAQIHDHVSELLRWVGLGNYLHARPRTLSGGQQQRLAIARAVIAKPRLLLADEPTGNLDDAIGMRLMHLFQELNRTGTTVVIATHNDQLAHHFGYPRMVLDQGKVAQLPPEARA